MNVDLPGSTDLGTLTVPTAEQVKEPWVFRAGCKILRPHVQDGLLVFDIILDLGFGLYKQTKAVLSGHVVTNGHESMAVSFAENWCENGAPNELAVETVMPTIEGGWFVNVMRVELELETLKAIGLACLGDAMVEQGLMLAIEA